jgi:hypothetical protein
MSPGMIHCPVSIDNLHIVSGFQPHVAGQGSDALDTITLDHNRLIPTRRIPCAINQGAVRDHDGFLILAAHLILLNIRSGLPDLPQCRAFLLRNDRSKHC